MKITRGSFKVPIYECRVYVTLSSEFAPAIAMLPKELRECFKEHDPMKAAYFASSPATGDYALIFRNVETDPGLINHETQHLSKQILEDIGYRPRKGPDEPLAYLLRWLTNKVSGILKRR